MFILPSGAYGIDVSALYQKQGASVIIALTLPELK